MIKTIGMSIGSVLAFWLVAAASPTQTRSKSAPEKPDSPLSVESADPEFKLSLPAGYKEIKSSGGALHTFSNGSGISAAIVALYPLVETIERPSNDSPLPKLPDVRRTDVRWKSFTLWALAWSTTGPEGGLWTARSVQVPLAGRGLRVLVLAPPAKDRLADEMLQDVLTGLDGRSNWRVERPLGAARRTINAALGVVILAILLGGPLIGIRSARRRLDQKRKAPDASRANQGIETAFPRLGQRWPRVLIVVLALLALVLLYFVSTGEALSLITNRSFSDSFRDAVTLFEVLAFAAVTSATGFAWLRRMERGQVLLDLGWDRLRYLYLFAGALCVAASAFIWIATAMATRPPNWQMICLSALETVLGGQLLVRAFDRVQFTKKGIWCNFGLLRWEQIGSWQFTEDSQLVAAQGGGPEFVRLKVPPERRADVEEALSQYSTIGAAG